MAQNLWQRLRLVARAALADFVSEEQRAQRQPDELASRLAVAEAQLAELRRMVDEATAREKQAEREWRKAQAESEALDTAVDAALQANNEPLASQTLSRLQHQQAVAAQLASHHQHQAQIAAQLLATWQKLHTQLTAAQRQAHQLATQEQQATQWEQAAQTRRTLQQETIALQTQLETQTEQIARQLDRLAARAELERKLR